MEQDAVLPHVGIRVAGGEVLRLGMPRDEAEPLLRRDGDVRADFRGSPPVVAFIESPKHWGSLDGIGLFESSADEVVAEIVRRYGFDPAVYRPGRHQYYFPALAMCLWRSCVSDSEDEQGYFFDSVSLHAPGYYDAHTIEDLREDMGLPPAP